MSPFPHTYAQMLTPTSSAIRPNGDVSITGDWNPATLWSALDEITPDDQTDDVYSDTHVSHLASTDYVFTVDMSTPSPVPSSGQTHRVSVRVRREDITGLTVPPHRFDCKVELLDTTTVRAVRTFTNIDPFWITRTYNLTTAEIAAITSYSNLRVRLTATLINGIDFEQMRARCTWIEMRFI